MLALAFIFLISNESVLLSRNAREKGVEEQNRQNEEVCIYPKASFPINTNSFLVYPSKGFGFSFHTNGMLIPNSSELLYRLTYLNKLTSVFTLESNMNVIYGTNLSDQKVVRVLSEGQVLETINVNYGSTVTISAPEIDEKVFVHWSINDSIVSYNPELTITIYHNLDIEAVYVEEEHGNTIERVPVSFLNDQVLTDGSNVYFLALSSVVEGYEIVEQG